MDFINDAQGETSVKVLLRKMKVLASFTKTPELKQWADLESNGYPPETTLPTYRGPFPVMVLGHFAGYGSSEIRNLPIPPSTFPEKFRDGNLFNVAISQGVAEIEAYTTSEKTEFAWIPDIVRGYNIMVHKGVVSRYAAEGYELVGAKFVVTRSQFEGVLDAIQNKALDLALELQQVAPNAGEAYADPRTNEDARNTIIQYISYVFPNADMSGSNNAFGSSDFGQEFGAPTIP